MAQAGAVGLLPSICKCLQPDDAEATYHVALNMTCCSHDNTTYIQPPIEPEIRPHHVAYEDGVDGRRAGDPSGKDRPVKKHILQSQTSRRLRDFGRTCCCFKIVKRPRRGVADPSTNVYASQVAMDTFQAP